MSSFNAQPLFDSGPHHFLVHGLAQRHEVHDRPGSDGAALTSLGATPRHIEQRGTLLADHLSAMEQQRQAIESLLDGQTYTLIDEADRQFEQVMMTKFEPGPVRRVGLRLAMDYRIDYVQNGSPR